MGPHQHGEIFVTEDGAETDLDLGHYERFIDQNLTRDNNITTGKIYWSVIESERKGLYRGQTVQVIPHITDEIKSRMQKIAQNSDIDLVITEIGAPSVILKAFPFSKPSASCVTIWAGKTSSLSMSPWYRICPCQAS